MSIKPWLQEPHAAPPHFPWGLQEADLEWTTVKQSFLTEVEQLSR